ncbi:MAG: sulfotransferase family protein, partial [Actinomycetota bacterium]
DRVTLSLEPGGRVSGNDVPIFVVGFQRSGTTLTQALLGAHSRIGAPPEMHFVFRVARFAGRYGDLTDDDNLRSVVHDALNPPANLFAECGYDEDRIFERARRGDRTMRSVLDAVMSDFAERRGKARWSEKSPGQSMAQVESLFPDAQIIHIVRDPRDVIASSLATPWTRNTAHTLAHRWRQFTVSNVRRGLLAGPTRFLQLRYEDLTRDPEAVLRVVFAFLGERYEPEILSDPDRRRDTIAPSAAPWQRRALEAVTPPTPSGWRTRLSRRDRLIVQSVFDRELAVLGYSQAPRKAIVAGRVLDQPIRAWDAIRKRWVGRRLGDPSRFELAIRDYLEEQARIVQNHA